MFKVNTEHFSWLILEGKICLTIKCILNKIKVSENWAFFFFNCSFSFLFFPYIFSNDIYSVGKGLQVTELLNKKPPVLCSWWSSPGLTLTSQQPWTLLSGLLSAASLAQTLQLPSDGLCCLPSCSPVPSPQDWLEERGHAEGTVLPDSVLGGAWGCFQGVCVQQAQCFPLIV